MPCCKCLLISQEDFYSYDLIPMNISNIYLEQVIQDTQVEFIEPLLCNDLIEELCFQIENNTLTALNEELLCLIRDIHVRYAFANFIERHPLKITKESVVRKVSDESEFVDMETIYSQAQRWRSIARSYIFKLKSFLKDNVNLNPLYSVCYCNCESIKTDTSNGFNIF